MDIFDSKFSSLKMDVTTRLLLVPPYLSFLIHLDVILGCFCIFESYFSKGYDITYPTSQKDLISYRDVFYLLKSTFK